MPKLSSLYGVFLFAFLVRLLTQIEYNIVKQT